MKKHQAKAKQRFKLEPRKSVIGNVLKDSTSSKEAARDSEEAAVEAMVVEGE